MDKISAQNLIKDTFNYPFNEEKFSKFSVNLLDQIKTNSSSVWLDNTNLPLPLRENVMQYKIFGQMEYENGEKIIISMIKLKSAEIVEKSRYIQRDFAKWLIDKNDSDACLISFFTDNYDDWRFSLVKIDYKREETKTGKIKVKQELTPLRRYSYLVGKNEPNHTAQTQLAPLLEKENVNMNDIIDAFSVEKVTKEFFDNYKNLCFEIIKDIKNLKLKDKKIKEEFRINNIDEYDFAKKVMSQIVFLYFLQKRGLLGIKKDKNNAYKQWGTGSKNFIRELFDQKHKKYNNFYNDILEPLFFEGLARERDEDNFAFLDCKIPFLNGGLFERYYNWSETYLILSNDIIKKIFDTFDRFNFTVVEEDPVDKEVAIDPEILGKVFESLIDIKERKKQGIFYTPREIVNFMCKETLSNFIFSQLEEQGIKYDKSRIGVLLDHNHNFWLTNTKINIEKETLIFIYEKLKNIKICDPAIGSGAFQLGMLNKLVFALKKLRESTSKYQVSDYRLKKNIIQKNLYGVDIENSSVEIGRLRLWLSLIIEDESVKKLEPLPNLEYKIVKGNSLSAVKENLFNSSYLEKLIPLKEEYFFEANFSRKTKLKNNIIQI